MKAGVAQSRRSKALKIGRGNRPAKDTARPEADVVGHHHDNVWRALGRRDCRHLVGLRLGGIGVDYASKRLGRYRKHAAVDASAPPANVRRKGGARRNRNRQRGDARAQQPAKTYRI